MKGEKREDNLGILRRIRLKHEQLSMGFFFIHRVNWPQVPNSPFPPWKIQIAYLQKLFNYETSSLELVMIS